MKPLYLDNLPALEKSFRKEAAYTARLSEAPENWPQEVTSELYKQLPFLSDYELQVNMERVDAAKGAAFGYADVSNKTERPEMEHDEAGLPHIRIPIVVKEKAVKPFSVYLDGERTAPLTEERVREVLFNPGAFDLTTAQPQDPNLQDNLQPPSRTGGGMGEVKTASANRRIQEGLLATKARLSLAAGRAPTSAQEYGSYKGMARAAGKLWQPGESLSTGKYGKETAKGVLRNLKPKMASARGSLLMAIAPTIREEDIEAFTEKVASDPSLVAGFRRSGIAEVLVDALEKTKRASADERLEALAAAVAPTVMTIQKLPGGDFLVKSANVNAFQAGPEAAGQVVPEEEVAGAMGEENAEAMQPGQVMTVSTGGLQEHLEARHEKPADEFGEWLVADAMGNRLMGWVFPRTLAWDGSFTPQDIALFTNGSAYAYQDCIQGELIGKGITLPEDEPRGDGVFYTVATGKAVCTAPITIQGSAAGPDGLPKFQGSDAFGTPVQVSFQDGLREPVRVTDTEYAFPSSWKFMRLNNQTQLASSAGVEEKLASALGAGSAATLFYNGAWQLEGGCGLHKLASAWYQDMDAVHAEFMLGLLGLEGGQAKQKVAEARKRGQVKLAGLKTVYLLGEQFAAMEKKAAAFLATVPDLKRDLIKEAAALEDTGTVDHLLALNFVNPENLSTFAGYVPELEQTGERLSEMLLTSYLGQSELPEGALERAVKNIEEVTSSLKALSNAEPS